MPLIRKSMNKDSKSNSLNESFQKERDQDEKFDKKGKTKIDSLA